MLSATAPGRQAADGLGTMDVSPDSVLAFAVTTLTFTYTVPTTIKELYGGSFTLTVAPGWTPPALAPGPGHVKASCVQSARVGCKLSVDRQQIKVTGIDLRQGQTLIITYGKTAAPGPPQPPEPPAPLSSPPSSGLPQPGRWPPWPPRRR